MGITGKWITDGTTSPFYARCAISIEKPIKKAAASVCGLGQFIFSINGRKVSDHELEGSWTNYSKVIEYTTYDVTDCFHQGDNVLGAEVGNGWYIMNNEGYTFGFPSFMPPNPNPYKPYGKSLVFTMTLEIEYIDGASERIDTGENWKVSRHYCTQSNVYGSETYDGRIRRDGWNKPGFDDSSWNAAVVVSDTDVPKAELIEMIEPPIKTIHTYEGKLIGSVNGRDIYDFGQNMSGMLTITAKGSCGDTVRIYPAEKIGPDGDIDQIAKGWLPVDTVITVILAGDECETFRSQFAYFAGKVVAVEKSSEEIEIISISADAISSAWKTDGSFTCDDERYNQIYNMIERTVEANMVSVHTDCPQIERFAWQEPNHLMAPSIMFMKDGKDLWDKFLMDMRKSQHDASDTFYDYDGSTFHVGDGLMPSQCPCYIPNVPPVPGMGSFYDTIAWGSTAILGARWHYRFYGDISIVEKNYDSGLRYLNYLKTKVNEYGFINHGLGDWGNPDGEMARENVETAFLYADTVALQEFAELLGKKEDAALLSRYAEEVRDNYNRRLLVEDEAGHYFYRSYEHQDKAVMTQAIEAMPLYFGIVPDYAEEDVKQAFYSTLTDKKCFASGEIGLPYIIQTARTCGWNDLIASYITREEHPSYYAFIINGMTTLGEYWESNPRSHCHDMMGHIIEWYYNGIAGIQPLEPGFRRILIRPYLPDSMNSFICSYNSIRGRITVSVKREKEGVRLKCSVPDTIEYEIHRDLLESH